MILAVFSFLPRSDVWWAGPPSAGQPTIRDPNKIGCALAGAAGGASVAAPCGGDADGGVGVRGAVRGLLVQALHEARLAAGGVVAMNNTFRYRLVERADGGHDGAGAILN